MKVGVSVHVRVERIQSRRLQLNIAYICDTTMQYMYPRLEKNSHSHAHKSFVRRQVVRQTTTHNFMNENFFVNICQQPSYIYKSKITCFSQVNKQSNTYRIKIRVPQICIEITCANVKIIHVVDVLQFYRVFNENFRTAKNCLSFVYVKMMHLTTHKIYFIIILNTFSLFLCFHKRRE